MGVLKKSDFISDILNTSVLTVSAETASSDFFFYEVTTEFQENFKDICKVNL